MRTCKKLRDKLWFLCTFSVPAMLPLKDLVSYEDREIDEKGEGLNQFDPPPSSMTMVMKKSYALKTMMMKSS